MRQVSSISPRALPVLDLLARYTHKKNKERVHEYLLEAKEKLDVQGAVHCPICGELLKRDENSIE